MSHAEIQQNCLTRCLIRRKALWRFIWLTR